MKVTESVQHTFPKLVHQQDSRGDKPALHYAKLDIKRPKVDLVEISPEARRLADDAVIRHEVPKLDSLPHEMVGAPDDYIKMEHLMKRFEPETYDRFLESIKQNAVDGLSILLKFAKKVPENPHWIEIYKAEVAERRNSLEQGRAIVAGQ